MDIFNLTAEAIEASKAAGQQHHETSKSLYKPSPKESKDGHYKAIVRFLPNPEAKSREELLEKSLVPRYYRWFNHLNGELKNFTTPEKCCFDSAFFAARKSESASVQDRGKAFLRKVEYFAYVLISQDQIRPELNGKIMIMKFGKKVYDKIMEEITPTFGQPSNPFNCASGKNFIIDLKEVGGYPNWDSCRFESEFSALKIEGEAFGSEASKAHIAAWRANFPKGLEEMGNPYWDATREALAQTIVEGLLPEFKK
jgi:hypothetical protein